MPKASETRLTGGCQCGAVRYELSAMSPRGSVCHCRMCQKASGQPFMALAPVGDAQLRWTHGSPEIFKSSNLAERGFCKACGTPLTYRFVGSGEISVAMGSLDDPEAIRPDIQYGIEGKVSWVDTIAGLPAQSTDEWLDSKDAARLVNNQHPDRE